MAAGNHKEGAGPEGMFCASQRGPCLFPVRACLGCGSSISRGWWSRYSTAPFGAVPTPSANASETQCDIAACVLASCHKVAGVVKPALPTDSAALLRSAKQPAQRFGSSQAPNRRAGFGLRSPWITPELSLALKRRRLGTHCQAAAAWATWNNAVADLLAIASFTVMPPFQRPDSWYR